MESKDSIILQIKIEESAGGKNTEKAKVEVDALATSIVGLAKANKQLREERNKLDTSTEEGAKRIQELNKLIDHNNELIKKNSSNLEKQRMNVGNYKRGVVDALKELRIGGVNVGDVVDKLSKANEDLFQGMIQGYKNSGIQAKLFGTTARAALTMTGIGVLIAGLATVIAHWDDITDAIGISDKRFQDHIDKAKKGTEELNTLLETRLALMKAAGVSEKAQLDLQIQALQEEISAHKQLQQDIAKQASEDVIKRLGKRAKQYKEEADIIKGLTDKLNILILTRNKMERDDEAKAAEEAKKAAEERAKNKQKEYDDLARQHKKHIDEKIAEEQYIADALKEIDEDEYKRRTQQSKIVSDKEWETLNETKRQELEAQKKQNEALGELYWEDVEAKKAAEEAKKAAIEAGIHASIEEAQNLADSINAISEVRANNEIRRIQKLQEQGLISKEKADKQIEAIERKSFERNKRLSIAQTIIDTLQGVARALKDFIWPFNLIVGGIVAGVGAAQVAAIRNTSYALGGQVDSFDTGGRADKRGTFQGPSHAGGGITYVRSDGKHRINVEGGENFYVLKKSASAELNYLSSLNQKHGGRSFGQKTWYAAQGGQIETREIAGRSNNIERTVRSVMANMPPIIVAVEDINTAQGRVARVQSKADF